MYHTGSSEDVRLDAVQDFDCNSRDHVYLCLCLCNIYSILLKNKQNTPSLVILLIVEKNLRFFRYVDLHVLKT